MKRKEFVNQVFSKLEETHINLFHSISKEEFEKHMSEFLRVCEDLDEVHFEAGICHLFSLFKDGHTQPKISDWKMVDAKILCVEGIYYIKNSENKFEKITRVNGVEIKEVEKKLSEFICYENEAWKTVLMEDCLASIKFLSFADFAKITDEFVTYSTEKGKIVSESMSKKSLKNDLKQKKHRFYYGFDFSDDLLYVRYFRCFEDPDKPFSQFLEEIKSTCKILPKACLLDVRNNRGGSSLIIHPLIDWLKENKIKSYVLANEGTYSSGRFAVIEFKLDLNATQLGTTIGSPAVAYGEAKTFSVGGKTFSASTKFFDFSEKLGCTGNIEPDVVIKQDVEELNHGRNAQRMRAIEFVKKEMNFQKERNKI